MTNDYTRGLVIGKFFPPHRGHQYLLRTALAQCDVLYVILGSQPTDDINGEVRRKWLQEMVPGAMVHHAFAVDEAEGHPRPWEVWARDALATLDFTPEVVFSSEDYGEPFAAALGARHVMVDKARTVMPISASDIRADPYAHWNYLAAPVRGHYARRVAIVGGESCGKTTLAVELAKHFTTVWMPEYGREFVDRKPGIPTPTESKILTEETLRRQDALAREANRVLICDTELIVLKVLADLHFGYSPQHILDGIAQQRFDLYLLADDDIPWVGDGVHREGADVRRAQTEQFKAELAARGIPVHVIGGNVPTRVAQAAELIEGLFEVGEA